MTGFEILFDLCAGALGTVAIQMIIWPEKFLSRKHTNPSDKK